MIDIYRYFAIHEGGAKRICPKRDSLLGFIFYLFLIVVTYYYTSSAYQFLKGAFRARKKNSDAKKGLLKDFDEDKLRLISRDNRDIIKDLRTAEWHKVSTDAVKCFLCKGSLDPDTFEKNVNADLETPQPQAI